MRLFLLVYVLFVFLGPMITGGTWRDWAGAALSIAIFLPLYFAVWRAIDEHREGRALLFSTAIALLGIALIPLNMGANTYVVYAGALVPFLVSPRAAIGYLLALAASVALISLALPEAARLWLVVPTTLLIIMIGGANVFYAVHYRQNALLWRAQEEIEEMATLAERERISRDLHDLLGHTLSVIALKSELASKLAGTDPQRAIVEICDVERVSRDALSEVRAAVEGFRGRGFSGELRTAARALESAGVRLEATVAPVAMSVRHESIMALSLREALTNVVRHARATTCRVTLAEESDRLVLTVRDDGIGCTAGEGYGLTGMRERVAGARGTVTIEATDGTSITVSLPRDDETADRPVPP